MLFRDDGASVRQYVWDSCGERNAVNAERQETINGSNNIAMQIAALKIRLSMLDREKSEIGERLAALERELLVGMPAAKQPDQSDASVTMASPTADKIALFRSLFRGREDVLPRRWENAKTGKAGYAPMCRNEWVRGICGKPQVKCGECPNQAFVPLSDDVVRAHLSGKAQGSSADSTVGVYPMLPDETCWFLATDFDKKSWKQDVAAFRDTARAKGHRAVTFRKRRSCLDILLRAGASLGGKTFRHTPDHSDDGS
jgi:hypothetical protein